MGFLHLANCPKVTIHYNLFLVHASCFSLVDLLNVSIIVLKILITEVSETASKYKGYL